MITNTDKLRLKLIKNEKKVRQEKTANSFKKMIE